MLCPNCRNENLDTASYCVHCGADLTVSARKTCPACGQENERTVSFCSVCGALLGTPEPASSPQYGVPPQREFVYAGFWLRVVAYIIDGVVANIAMLPPRLMLGLPFGMMDSYGDEAEAFGCGCIYSIFSIIVVWLYYALMESSVHQGTLGKMALGIKVTDLEGNQVTFGRATGRYFGKILSALILGIGFIMAGFTEKKQALHDMLAGCLVVMKK